MLPDFLPYLGPAWGLLFAWAFMIAVGYVLGFSVAAVIGFDLFPVFPWASDVPFHLIWGAVFGLVQWALVRSSAPHGARISRWLLASAFGYALGGIVSALGNFDEALQSEIDSGIGSAFVGIGVGASQGLVLGKPWSRLGWWVLANAVGFFIAGYLLGGAAAAGFGVFLALPLGGAAVGLTTGLVFIWLFISLRPPSGERAEPAARKSLPQPRTGTLLLVIGIGLLLLITLPQVKRAKRAAETTPWESQQSIVIVEDRLIVPGERVGLVFLGMPWSMAVDRMKDAHGILPDQGWDWSFTDNCWTPLSLCAKLHPSAPERVAVLYIGSLPLWSRDPLRQTPYRTKEGVTVGTSFEEAVERMGRPKNDDRSKYGHHSASWPGLYVQTDETGRIRLLRVENR